MAGCRGEYEGGNYPAARHGDGDDEEDERAERYSSDWFDVRNIQ